ncbi:PPC domain-containing DNA-binding protein [Salipiger sp.]|uniref:PPC domain-containing DNA-binding protein n=1 Tax=Salipiger sp. TaxID=2078585 RepID=UPI003A97CDF8
MTHPFSSAAGRQGRVIAARIHPGQDVLEAIEAVCLAHDLTCGQITTSIGSLSRVALHYVSRLKPTAAEGYNTKMVLEGPHSLLTGQGLVTEGDEPGRLNIHYHAVVSGAEDVIYGGHIEAGTITLTTLDLFVSEVEGVAITRARDPETGALVSFMAPAKVEEEA